MPAGRDAVVSAAIPDEFKFADPKGVDPFMKLTGPDTGVAPVVLTVATRVNGSPTTTGLGVAAKLMVVVVAVEALTVTETAGDVLVTKVELPTYCATKLYVPAGREAVDSVATPEAFKLADPNIVDPFMKCTVPEAGVVPEIFTVATRLIA